MFRRHVCTLNRMTAESFFASAPRYPKDAIFELTAEFKRDPSPVKVNLGQGTYRDNNAQPWILPSVAEARKRISNQKLDHEYLPILGLPEFRNATTRLVLGTDQLQSRTASCQALSGTGALHLAGALIKSSSSLKRQVWIPEPTWSNHHLVFGSLGFECHSFKYYDFDRRALDFDTYKSTLQSLSPGSIVILHACAHNPTGCDPTKEQWKEVGRIMKEKGLFPLFDAAYLGFNSGNFDDDAYPIRLFTQELGLEAAIAVSFAKNMGLYGERVGCTIFVAKDAEIATNCESVMERLQRSEVSNPPAFGAKIASQILNDPSLTKMWYNDLLTMNGRISQMRKSLHDALIRNGAPGDWSHITSQSGMFSFLGLPRPVVLKLKERYHVYMAENSRISIAGLNTSNVEHVAKSVTECLSDKKVTSSQRVQASL